MEEEDISPPHIDFRNVLDFVCDILPEARATLHRDRIPRAPGMPALTAPPPYVDLKQSDLLGFALQEASEALRQTAASRTSFVPLPHHKAYRGPWGHRKPATLNPDLAAQLQGSLDPRITTSQRDISQLETGLLASMDIQNFLIWFVGTYVTRVSPAVADSPDTAMLDRLLASINRAFTAQARVSAFTLANIRSLRREAFLSALPSRFQAAAKRTLRSSPMNTDSLFGPEQVAEASNMAKEAASFSLSEAAARALARPAPRSGTPLVGRPSRKLSSTTASSSATNTQPRTSVPSTSQTRDRSTFRSSFPTGHTSSRHPSGKWRGSRSFRR